MQNTHKLRGGILALLSAVSISLVYIVSKSVQKTLPTRFFLLWWFASASIWATVIVVIKRKDFSCYVRKVKKHILFFLYFAASEAFGAFVFFYVIKLVNPAVVSFLGSITPLFVAVIAFFWIGEKLSLKEIIGGALSMLGVLLITYVSPDVDLFYALLILLTVLIYSYNNVLVKKKTEDIPPLLITLVRIYLLESVYLIYNLINGGIRLPDFREAVLLAGGSLFGPILGMLALFTAFKYIKSTEVSLIKNSQPFFVVIFSYFILGISVTGAQLLAGILIVSGITLIISEKRMSIRAILNRFVKN